MRILAATLGFTPKGFVRIGDIDHQTKRFPGCLGLGNPISSRNTIGFWVFHVAFGAIRERVEIGIPRVGLIRSRVAHLASDTGEVAGLFHQVHQVRPARIFYLIKPLHLVVVRVQAREHHVAAGHAVAHRDMRMSKAQ